MAEDTAVKNQINLNTADEEELRLIEGVGPQRAHILVENRPYKNMQDLKRVPGFDDELIQTLEEHGATVETETQEIQERQGG